MLRTGAPSQLVLGEDQLAGSRVLGVGDGVVHDADTAHHLGGGERGGRGEGRGEGEVRGEGGRGDG